MTSPHPTTVESESGPEPSKRSDDTRMRVPLPEWMLTWPRGIVPSQLFATARQLQLHYALPDGRRVELDVYMRAQGGIEVAAKRPTKASAGLAFAVRRRLVRRSPWLRAVCRLVPRVASQTPGPRQPGLEALEPSPLAGLLSPQELEARAPAAKILELLAQGEVGRAFGCWDRNREDMDRDEGAVARFCVALLHGLSGRPRAARAHLERGPERLRDPEHARAIGALLTRLGAPERACELLAWTLHHGGHWSDRVELARAASQARAPQSAARALEEDPRWTPERRVEAARLLIDADCFDEAEARLRALLDERPDHLGANLCLARLRLWWSDAEELGAIVDHLRAVAPDQALHHLTGPLAVLRGDYALAITELEVARSQTQDGDEQGELTLWLAEAMLHAGRLEEALAEAIWQPFRRCHPLAHLLQIAIEMRLLDGKLRGDTPIIARVLLSDLGLPLSPEGETPYDTLALAAVRTFGGNRSQFPTRVLGQPPRLERLHEPISPRGRAAELQDLLFTEVPQRVLESFEALAERFPGSPYAVTYGAEINLWLGNYARALEQFEATIDYCGTRWAYIGAGSALFFLGEHERALERWDASFRLHLPLAHVATHAYRGELWRLMGKTDEARKDLEHAEEHAPARVGPAINLALLDLAAGHIQRAREAMKRAQALTPLLSWEACKAAGLAPTMHLETLAPDDARAVLEASLALLRGNRSSTIYTFFDSRALLRVISPGDLPRWLRVAKEDGLPLADDARILASLPAASLASAPAAKR